jgi:hypothetical protein
MHCSPTLAAGLLASGLVVAGALSPLVAADSQPATQSQSADLVACFLNLGDLCISQANAISGAFVTGIAALVAVGLKFLADRGERIARQNFETSERKAREEWQQAAQRELQEFISLGKFREESWERRREQLDKAAALLSETVRGINKLIDLGPNLDDFQMIRETAAVLDSFARFTSEAQHHGLPSGLKVHATTVADHVTKTLLTLSPIQEVRQRPDRKADLAALKTGLEAHAARYWAMCNEYEQNPKKFDDDAV